MKQDVDSMSEQFNEIQNNVGQSHDLITQINGSLEYNSTEMKDSFKDMEFANDRVFMSLAKLDHVLWKVNTYYSAVTKKEQFKFVDHHNCRLGKWYYEGDGKDNFSKTSNYSKLETPHAIVHNGTHKVFELMVAQPVDTKALAAAFDEMEQGSDAVFKTLDEILIDNLLKIIPLSNILKITSEISRVKIDVLELGTINFDKLKEISNGVFISGKSIKIMFKDSADEIVRAINNKR